VAYINNELLKKNIPKTRGVEDPTATVNPFLQIWEPAKQIARSKLPTQVHTMIKTVKKYNLQFLPPTPNNTLKGQMLAWFHTTHRRSKKTDQPKHA
jgi:hypothetical protein